MSRFNEHGLTAQQERFAQEVAQGKSLSDAYRKAYPRSEKWKQETVHEKASRAAANAKVSARIAQLRAAVAKASILQAAEILNETRRVALSSVRSLFGPDGKLLRPHELDPDTAAAISSFEVGPDGTIKYRFWDKGAACDRASRILGLYERDHAQKNTPIREMLASLGAEIFEPRKTVPENDDHAGDE
jgi:phage terminase small subunit